MAGRSVLGRAFGAAITLPLTLLAVAFAVSNRGPVAVGLWPFDELVEMPVYLLGLGALALGFLAGVAVAGFGALSARLRARREARRADAAERKLALPPASSRAA
jgi:lipopolysaccharide assembly protein A